jgi:hypothetical protein
VLIASPSDALLGRDAVERNLHAWNDHRTDESGFILRPRRWEIASVPLSGRGDAQSIINSQLVDEADIVIGIFYHRLGTVTPRAISGTAEEIERAIKAGKPVHLYFAKKPLPYDHDAKQFQALRQFRKLMADSGWVLEFNTEEDLAQRAQQAIELDIRDLRKNLPKHPSPSTGPNLPVEEKQHDSAKASAAGEASVEETAPVNVLNVDDLTADDDGAKSSSPGLESPEHQRSVWRYLVVGIVVAALAFTAGWLVGRQSPRPQSSDAPTSTPTSAPASTQPSDPPTSTSTCMQTIAAPTVTDVYLIDLDWTTKPPGDKSHIKVGAETIDGRRYPNSLTLPGHETIRIDLDFKGKKYRRFSSMLGMKPNPAEPRSPDTKSSMPVEISATVNNELRVLASFSVQTLGSCPVDLALPPTATSLLLETETPASTFVIWGDPILRT